MSCQFPIIFFIIWSRQMLKYLQLFILHHIMKQGHWDLPISMEE